MVPSRRSGGFSPPRVLLYAYHMAGAACLEALLADGWPVVGLFTHPVSAEEARWLQVPAPIAHAAGIPVFAPKNPNSPRARKEAATLAPDIILSVMYRRLLGASLLAIPPLGAYNVHPSLLPRYRGRAPVNWVIVNGETETGVTLHHMHPEADAGDIVAQERLPVHPRETALTLHRRLVPRFVALVREMLPRIASGTAPRQPQDPAAATVVGPRGPADGAIDWRWPVARVDRLVRAVTRPFPGAFGVWEGRPLLVWQAEPHSEDAVGALADAPCGTARFTRGRLWVRAADGVLEIVDWDIEAHDAAGRLVAAARVGPVRLS